MGFFIKKILRTAGDLKKRFWPLRQTVCMTSQNSTFFRNIKPTMSSALMDVAIILIRQMEPFACHGINEADSVLLPVGEKAGTVASESRRIYYLLPCG